MSSLWWYLLYNLPLLHSSKQYALLHVSVCLVKTQPCYQRKCMFVCALISSLPCQLPVRLTSTLPCCITSVLTTFCFKQTLLLICFIGPLLDLLFWLGFLLLTLVYLTLMNLLCMCLSMRIKLGINFCWKIWYFWGFLIGEGKKLKNLCSIAPSRYLWTSSASLCFHLQVYHLVDICSSMMCWQQIYQPIHFVLNNQKTNSQG